MACTLSSWPSIALKTTEPLNTTVKIVLATPQYHDVICIYKNLLNMFILFSLSFSSL
jgi:hypothetical protein